MNSQLYLPNLFVYMAWTSDTILKIMILRSVPTSLYFFYSPWPGYFFFFFGIAFLVAGNRQQNQEQNKQTKERLQLSKVWQSYL